MLHRQAGAHRLACQPSGWAFTFIVPVSFQHPMARVYAKLLGPCFKTGRIGDQLLHREPTWERETPPQPPYK
jgi:hypothetical protein